MENDFRSEEILNLLRQKKKLSNQQLCQTLHCSVSTLRRDLVRLEARGLVKRTYGGVMLNVTTNNDYASIYREGSSTKEKKIIADLARDFVGPGMCVFLDPSSTVLPLCPYLKKIPNLVVVTNGLKNALALSEGENEGLSVFIIGGEIKNNSTAVINSSYDSLFSAFQFDLAIFSCRGIDERGIYEANFSQAKVKKEMMAKAKKTLLLADSSKFDSSHFFKIGDFKDYEALITDKKPPEAYQRICDDSEIELIWE